MIRFSFVVFALCVCATIFVSCEQEKDPCLQPTVFETRAGVYKAIEGDTGIVVTDSLLPNVLVGSPDTSAYFMYAQKNVRELKFLLSPQKDSTAITIVPDSAKQSRFDLDTVVFYYDRRLQFVSTSCGYTYYYAINNLRYTTYNIDSVIVANGNVTNDAKIQHVKIYY
jgi:hypothetical protein